MELTTQSTTQAGFQSSNSAQSSNASNAAAKLSSDFETFLKIKHRTA